MQGHTQVVNQAMRKPGGLITVDMDSVLKNIENRLTLHDVLCSSSVVDSHFQFSNTEERISYDL